MKDGARPPPHPEGSPSRAGITVLRRASTRPSGEPKRKKPETLKSRRAVLREPSGASEAAGGGQEAVLARRGSPEEEEEEEAAVGATCRLWGRAAQCCCLTAQHPPCWGGGRKVTCSGSPRVQDWPRRWGCAGRAGPRVLGCSGPAPPSHLPGGPLLGRFPGRAAHCSRRNRGPQILRNETMWFLLIWK